MPSGIGIEGEGVWYTVSNQRSVQYTQRLLLQTFIAVDEGVLTVL